MSQNAFIFMLVLGMTLLAGILTVAQVSAYRLNRRLELRRHKAASDQPELDLGTAGFGAPEIGAPRLTVQARHPETAR